MNNPRMRNKQKRDNLSEGGEGVGFLMEIQEQRFDNQFFWKDNKSWYQQPQLHHFSPEISRNYSNVQQQNEDQQCYSDRMYENDINQVRSLVPTSTKKLTNTKKQSNKSQCYGMEMNQPSKLNAQMGCKCTKISCLKRTCGCFDDGKFCGINCICKGCKNIEQNKSQIQKCKVQAKLRSNRSIFDNIDYQMPEKVCTCPKSRCQKKYCQCYQAGIACNEFCKCMNCLNTGNEMRQQKYQNGSTIQKSSYQKSIGKEI